MPAETLAAIAERVEATLTNQAKVLPLEVQRDRREEAIPWPPLALPGSIATPDIPADVLPSYLGAYAGAVAAATQTPPAASVAMGLVVAAIAIQGRIEVAPTGDDYREPTALNVCGAMESGSRKTEIVKRLTLPLLHYEKDARERSKGKRDQVLNAREVAKKRLEALALQAGKTEEPDKRDALRRQMDEVRAEMPEEIFEPYLYTTNVTAERVQQMLVEQHGRAAVVSDEAGQFAVLAGLYSGAPNLDVFLQGHAGSPIRVDRAGRVAHVPHPALSMGFLVQPGVLAAAAANRHFRDAGLLARQMFVMPPTTVGTRDVRARAPVPDEVHVAYQRGMRGLLAGWTEHRAGAHRTVPFATAARELWLDFAQAIEHKLAPGGELAAIADWGGKLPGLVARLAAIMHVVEHGLEVEMVELTAVERAVRLGHLLIPHALRAFRLFGADDVEADALALLAWVRRLCALTFSRREAHKALEGRFRKVDDLVAAATRLREWGVLSAPRTDKKDRGRPSVYYEVNPRLFVDDSLESP